MRYTFLNVAHHFARENGDIVHGSANKLQPSLIEKKEKREECSLHPALPQDMSPASRSISAVTHAIISIHCDLHIHRVSTKMPPSAA